MTIFTLKPALGETGFYALQLFTQGLYVYQISASCIENSGQNNDTSESLG